MQLAHAGRKASTYRPWDPNKGEIPAQAGGWPTIGPSPIRFTDNYPLPKELSIDEIHALTESFVKAAQRAFKAGFRVIELHSAHGYLFHEFLSPLSNMRTDRYGGAFENRARFLLETVVAVRKVWPEEYPLFVRLSCSEWVDGGFGIDEAVSLAAQLKTLGVDLVDCSSGGNASHAKIPAGPGYQTPFAARIRRDTGILTGAVGMIVAPEQADQIIRNGDADLVFLARELLRDPYWPMRAAKELGQTMSWPAQYLRAGPANAPERG
jgi:2,4-dienoyl-CoA reductase-like NADH-dependent reductase (Old Yellow Enzyme family)